MASTHGRRQLRLRGHDYSQPGAYFITICTINGADLLGRVVGTEMQLNEFGEVAARNWCWLGSHFPVITLDEWVIMPTHLHGIVVLTSAEPSKETRVDSVATSARRKPLGELIGAFKTRSTKEINELRRTAGARFWQRNYWDRVIQDEAELLRIRGYIRQNPANYRPRTYAV